MYKVVGDYQLTEKIGKGNFADVYLGISQKTSMKYAVKVISKETFSDPRLIAGLDAEIKIMKEFIHPNIVQLFKYFSSEKNYYLVVEYCKGGDLNKFIKKNGRLNESLSLQFLIQLTEGLFFLHEKNFIHRDLKPANVLLSESIDSITGGNNGISLKLADFGFARHLSTASLAQTRCGTPLYMAPEILEARDYDNKADVWSLGCIFFEMLVGTSPFKGTNETDLLHNIRTQSLKVPGHIEVSKVSIGILVKLLERSSSKRASIEQLAIITRKMIFDQDNSKSGDEGIPMKQSSIDSTNDTSSQQMKDSGIAGVSKDIENPHNIPIPPALNTTFSPGSYRSDIPKPVRSPSNQQLNEQEKVRSSSVDGPNLAMTLSPIQQPAYLLQNPSSTKLPGYALQHATKVESPIITNDKHVQRNSITSSSKMNPLVPLSIDQNNNNIQAPSSRNSGKVRSISADQHIPNSSGSYKASSPGVATSPFFPGFPQEEYLLQQQTPKVGSFKDANFLPTGNYYNNPSVHSTPRNSFTGADNFPGYPNIPQPPAPSPSTSYPSEGLMMARSPYTPGQYLPPPSSSYPQQQQQLRYPLNTNPIPGVDDDGFVVVDPNSNSNPGVLTSPLPTSSRPQNNSPTTQGMSGIGYNLTHNITNLPQPPTQQPSSTKPAPDQYLQTIFNHTGNTPPTLGIEPITSRPGSYAKGIWDFSKLAAASSSYGQPSQFTDPTSEGGGELNDSFMFRNHLQRCELYCDMINVITNIADQIVLQDQQSQSRSQSSTETMTTKEVMSEGGPLNNTLTQEGDESTTIPILKKRNSIRITTTITAATASTSNTTIDASSNTSTPPPMTGNRMIEKPQLQREETVDVSLNVKNVNESIDHYLAACSLYFHALTILKNLINSLSAHSETPEHQHLFHATSVLMTIKNDLSVMFDQLLHRGENCQKIIEQLIQLSPHQSYYHKVLIPKPEILMIQEAGRLENEANMEDLLGNLPRAANLYTIAKKLVNGVTLTYSEEDARKVRNQLKSFTENIEIKLSGVQHKMKVMKSFTTTGTNSINNNNSAVSTGTSLGGERMLSGRGVTESIDSGVSGGGGGDGVGEGGGRNPSSSEMFSGYGGDDGFSFYTD